MKMYKASIGITTNMGVAATSWIAESTDRLGVDSIWVGEDIGLGQDPFVLSAACITATKKARVGTGIVPVTVHNITTLARAALTLADISSGRFVLGTGIGGLQDLDRLGVRPKHPVTTLRRGIELLRQLWSGEEVTNDSDQFPLDHFSLRVKSTIDIPIYLGVRGPQMLRLAGQVADGVILSGPPQYLRFAVDEINRAAAASGRKDRRS